MCGICGFNWGDENLINSMANAIVHRGPDHQGTAVFPEMSIGNARLSIIDLSDHGNQPMYDPENRFSIVYNGEIYNFLEIRKELQGLGYNFKSKTDTETVLLSYVEWGEKCLERFNGMFGIAIWDKLEKTLFLARDRIGIKPLYYYHNAEKFIFASEIKCILKSDYVRKEVDPQSLYNYLGHEFVPAPNTMFKGIKKLPQGHYAIFRNNELEIHKYWEINFQTDSSKSEEDFADELFSLMEKSVERRLLSDVPLGVFLSGGLDSSTLAGFVKRLYPEKVKTFSIGYKDKSFSELPYAKQVSDFLGTEHNVLMIDPVSPEDIEDSLYHLDEPMTDLSTIPFRLIARKAREQVKVCLSGEGGDEVLLGYDRFKAARLNRFYSFIPGIFRNSIINPLVMSLPDQPQKKGLINMLKRFIEGSRYPKDIGAMRWQFFLDPMMERKIIHNNWHSAVDFETWRPIRSLQPFCNSSDPVDRDIFVDIKLTMADSVLMKVDKMSMSNSLEVRVPFLDHELIEYAATIPHSLKLKGTITKYILRKALERNKFLPENIINRGKQGYSLPVKNWLREDLKPYMIDLFSSSPLISEYINQDTLNVLIDEHMQRKHNHNHILWALMNAALWYKRFF